MYDDWTVINKMQINRKDTWMNSNFTPLVLMNEDNCSTQNWWLVLADIYRATFVLFDIIDVVGLYAVITVVIASLVILPFSQHSSNEKNCFTCGGTTLTSTLQLNFFFHFSKLCLNDIYASKTNDSFSTKGRYNQIRNPHAKVEENEKRGRHRDIM